jgi:hypothetical protein
MMADLPPWAPHQTPGETAPHPPAREPLPPTKELDDLIAAVEHLQATSRDWRNDELWRIHYQPELAAYCRRVCEHGNRSEQSTFRFARIARWLGKSLDIDIGRANRIAALESEIEALTADNRLLLAQRDKAIEACRATIAMLTEPWDNDGGVKWAMVEAKAREAIAFTDQGKEDAGGKADV